MKRNATRRLLTALLAAAMCLSMAACGSKPAADTDGGAGYYFGTNTKLKINGTLYSYRLVNVDPDYDSSGRIYAFWAYTDLTMAPQTSDTSPDYKITEGANGTWTQNSGGTLRFAANGDLSKFTGVQVDGKLLTADQYTATSGSTVVALKASYLTTLSAGKHTLTVVYTDGDCSTEFEIQSAGNTDPGNNDTPGDNTVPGSPETGDNSSIVLWLSLLFVGGAPVVLRKKREHR